MSETSVQRLLRNDSRTVQVAAHEAVGLPTREAETLLRVLGDGESVLALYRRDTGHAALTEDALILLDGNAATRVPRPLAVLRPAYGSPRRVDVSVDGRSASLWGSRIDVSGDLLLRTGRLVPGPLTGDSRIGAVVAGESVSLSDVGKKALLDELESGEFVRALYHDGWGYAALTGKGLILLRNILSPKAIRVTEPLRIFRGTYGLFDSVEILVDGKQRKLHGSKLDPKGKLLEAAGELLPPGSPLRPGRGTRILTWVRRHPVLMSVAVAVLFFTGAGSGGGAGTGSGEKEAAAEARADRSLTVPEFEGFSLSAAVAEAGDHSWLRVSAADASSAFRPVTGTEADWRVCFQMPARGETVRPSVRTLTLYAVPEREECPTQLLGTRRIGMPDLVGERFDDASSALGELGLARTVPLHAHTGKQLDGEAPDLAAWQVCRQQPESGTEVSTWTRVSLWLIGPGDPCTAPSSSPKPKPKPKPQPKPKADPEPSYGTSGGGTTGGSTGGGSTGGSSSTGGGTTGGGSSGSSGGGSSQGGARFGQSCSPVGATATTVDGRPAKCYMGKDGLARWGYYSG
ncbi:PASTA domain-containing protein [Streptomyces sp. NBC_00353]|uniref:PASTA domain-containing protein n=1 Tax=Streptomyces sp. NBC_00353 TaxID=2975722 RepID=UPI002E263E7E